MKILVRAILTGFGLKVGSELARAVTERVKSRFEASRKEPKKAESGKAGQDEQEDLPAGADLTPPSESE